MLVGLEKGAGSKQVTLPGSTDAREGDVEKYMFEHWSHSVSFGQVCFLRGHDIEHERTTRPRPRIAANVRLKFVV